MCPLSVKCSFMSTFTLYITFSWRWPPCPTHIVCILSKEDISEHMRHSEENEKEAGWGSRVQHRVVCVYFGNAAPQTYSRGTDS